MKKHIISIAILFGIFFVTHACSKKTDTSTTPPIIVNPVEPTPQVYLSATIPQNGGNTVANSSPGLGINSNKDGSLTTTALLKLSPKLIRWSEGGQGNKIHFNKSNPATFKVGVRDASQWWVNSMGINTTTWLYTPQLSFDNYVAQCKAVGAEPVVIVGINACYTTIGTGNMNKTEVIQCAKDFVEYANKTKGYGIKYWEIGNEDDLEGASAPVYASIFNQIVPQMKSVDPTIKCGANSMKSVARWDTLIPLVKANADFYINHKYHWMDKDDYPNWYTHESNWQWASGLKEHSDAIKKYPDAAQALYLTEISAFSPSKDDAKKNGNVTWRGLANIQMQLEALANPLVKANLVWVSRWTDDPQYMGNIFSPSYETTVLGKSIATYSAHLYNNLGPKIPSTTGYVTMWVSHNDSKNKMSVFLMNRDQTKITVAVTINGYVGNYQNDKWLFKGSSPTSYDVTLTQVASQNITGNTFNVTLDPLSCTVIDFRGI